MELIVRIKNVYGNELVYPVNATARTFAQIADKRTLSRKTIEHAKTLGFTVIVQAPEL